MWSKKWCNENLANIRRDLKPINGSDDESVEDLLKTQAELSKQADLLERLIDPLLESISPPTAEPVIRNPSPDRFTLSTTNINGNEWIIVDGYEEGSTNTTETMLSEPESAPTLNLRKRLFPFSNVQLGEMCSKQVRIYHTAVTDNSIKDQSTERYFGLSDDESIIIRFNVVEHRPLEGTRLFLNGIDYPGRRRPKKSYKDLITIGIEAKEIYRGSFARIVHDVCELIKNLYQQTKISIIAPPRLQALRSARRNGNASGANTPGEGVRAYALLLASDKTTTFAQNVDNFIACTKDSKETCPHVVMRNMRQFMSGMKNYLVKHGEREFEKEVEKERLKLKANEFLNLDTILEGVLHGAVVTPLRSHVYTLLADKFARRGDVALLANGMRIARSLPPLRLGVRPSVRIPSESEMVVISQYLVKMQEADSPLDKLENLLSAISTIFNSMKTNTSNGPLGADDFLPVFVLTLARCSVAGAELEAELMAGLLSPPILAGEGGYYLTTLFGAVAVLKRLASSDQDKSLDWRTGSLGSALNSGSATGNLGTGGVARVLVPDEAAGALRRVTLPWRSGARARDLCRALAHRARITNPQDYGLFALRDGEETLLGDSDCLQDFVTDNKSCMLAYKRIDAKIAWPKQALQSYP